MFFLGDAHGEWKSYRYVIDKMQLKGGKKGMDCSLVLGDMGMGFRNKTDDSKEGKSYIRGIDPKHKFICGNHDYRSICYGHPNFLGDYGYDEHSGIFYVGGGYSVDWQWREKYINWWPDEELSPGQMESCLKLYQKVKPKMVVAHECPTEVKYFAVTNTMKNELISRTEELLQKMVDSHRPDHFIFGHHHTRLEMQIGETQYDCLDSLSFGKFGDCILEIPGVTWG